MISLHFEVRYDAKEKVWYVYDEEGNYRKSQNLDEVPILIRDHINAIRADLQFVRDTKGEF